MEKALALEMQLRKKVKLLRLISGITTAVMWFLFFLFMILRESTKVVTEEVVDMDGFQYADTVVEYNNVYVVFAMIAFVLAMAALTVFLSNVVAGNVDCMTVKDDRITLYRGAIFRVLYINGEVKSQGGFFLEAPLSDGSTVTVSLSRYGFGAHMAFSNGMRPIDL